MSVISVVGAQFGDEGKGRIVDFLAQCSDCVIRYQGGDNAGHTVSNEWGKFALHMIPSGIFNPNAINIVGAGCVVNFSKLEKEMEGINPSLLKSFYIDRRAQVIFPFHIDLDGAYENNRSENNKIGTTKCGIGPCYSDKMSRIGLRAGDILDENGELESKLSKLLDIKNKELELFGLKTYEVDEIYNLTKEWKSSFKDRIVDTVPLVMSLVKENKRILLEGQLGVMRDIDWGIYPYSTSSSTTSGGAAALSGVPVNKINEVLGIVKAYTTSVGGGPFPTELKDELGDKLREIGAEYGVTTGRPRRCGWLDIVSLRESAYLNGFTMMAVTKLDILSDFDDIKLCVGYKLNDKTLTFLPSTDDMDRVEPIYEEFKGWNVDISKCRTWDELPANAKIYLNRIQELVGVKISFVSVGPNRGELIVVR